MPPSGPNAEETATTASRGQPWAALAARAVPAWALIPLRLFLGVTFIDAGAGKLLSAAYFGAGNQGFAALARGFAEGSPIGGLIRAVVLPHPFTFALLLAVVELVVGICTVLGLATRLAAGVGMSLSLAFYLTASWRVRPFFYGADLPFTFAWLTLLLAGHGGLPSMDAALLRRHLAERGSKGSDPGHAASEPHDEAPEPHGRRCSASACQAVTCPVRAEPPSSEVRLASRRAFLAAAAKAGQLGLATLILAVGAVPLVRRPEDVLTGPDGRSQRRVGDLRQLPVGQATVVTPSPQADPAIVVRLSAVEVVAYGAICTHATCVVDFDADRRLIVCACHGAEFDPRRNAAVVAGPAPRPLPRLKSTIQADGSIYVEAG